MSTITIADLTGFDGDVRTIPNSGAGAWAPGDTIQFEGAFANDPSAPAGLTYTYDNTYPGKLTISGFTDGVANGKSVEIIGFNINNPNWNISTINVGSSNTSPLTALPINVSISANGSWACGPYNEIITVGNDVTATITNLSANDTVKFTSPSAATYALTDTGLTITGAGANASTVIIPDYTNAHCANLLEGTTNNLADRTLTVSGLANFTATGYGFGKYNVTGTDATNIFITGTGADTITGGLGNDYITGGASADAAHGDKFVFNTGDGIDTITDGDLYDTIVINTTNATMTKEDIKYSLSGDDLVIKYSATDKIVISGFVTTATINDIVLNGGAEGTEAFTISDTLIIDVDLAELTPNYDKSAYLTIPFRFTLLDDGVNYGITGLGSKDEIILPDGTLLGDNVTYSQTADGLTITYGENTITSDFNVSGQTKVPVVKSGATADDITGKTLTVTGLADFDPTLLATSFGTYNITGKADTAGTLQGRAGADTITAGAAGSSIYGNGGADKLTAGEGVDKFYFNVGDGADVVIGAGATDEIYIGTEGADLTATVTYTRVDIPANDTDPARTDLEITYGGGTDKLTIQNFDFTTVANNVDTVKVWNGTGYTGADISATPVVHELGLDVTTYEKTTPYLEKLVVEPGTDADHKHEITITGLVAGDVIPDAVTDVLSRVFDGTPETENLNDALVVKKGDYTTITIDGYFTAGHHYGYATGGTVDVTLLGGATYTTDDAFVEKIHGFGFVAAAGVDVAGADKDGLALTGGTISYNRVNNGTDLVILNKDGETVLDQITVTGFDFDTAIASDNSTQVNVNDSLTGIMTLNVTLEPVGSVEQTYATTQHTELISGVGKIDADDILAAGSDKLVIGGETVKYSRIGGASTELVVSGGDDKITVTDFDFDGASKSIKVNTGATAVGTTVNVKLLSTDAAYTGSAYIDAISGTGTVAATLIAGSGEADRIGFAGVMTRLNGSADMIVKQFDDEGAVINAITVTGFDFGTTSTPSTTPININGTMTDGTSLLYTTFNASGDYTVGTAFVDRVVLVNGTEGTGNDRTYNLSGFGDGEGVETATTDKLYRTINGTVDTVEDNLRIVRDDYTTINITDYFNGATRYGYPTGGELNVVLDHGTFAADGDNFIELISGVGTVAADAIAEGNVINPDESVTKKDQINFANAKMTRVGDALIVTDGTAANAITVDGFVFNAEELNPLKQININGALTTTDSEIYAEVAADYTATDYKDVITVTAASDITITGMEKSVAGETPGDEVFKDSLTIAAGDGTKTYTRLSGKNDLVIASSDGLDPETITTVTLAGFFPAEIPAVGDIEVDGVSTRGMDLQVTLGTADYYTGTRYNETFSGGMTVTGFDYEHDKVAAIATNTFERENNGDLVVNGTTIAGFDFGWTAGATPSDPRVPNNVVNLTDSTDTSTMTLAVSLTDALGTTPYAATEYHETMTVADGDEVTIDYAGDYLKAAGDTITFENTTGTYQNERKASDMILTCSNGTSVTIKDYYLVAINENNYSGVQFTPEGVTLGELTINVISEVAYYDSAYGDTIQALTKDVAETINLKEGLNPKELPMGQEMKEPLFTWDTEGKITTTVVDDDHSLMSYTSDADGQTYTLDAMAFARGGADIVNGTAGNDWIHGGAGADTILGGVETKDGDTIIKGHDMLAGGAGDDVIIAGKVVATDPEKDIDVDTLKVKLNEASVEVYAGEGNDTIVGGKGGDFLWAGSGDDVITGGDGADKFVFMVGEDTAAAHDIITDATSDDVIKLIGITDFTDVTFAQGEEGSPEANSLLITYGDDVIEVQNYFTDRNVVAANHVNKFELKNPAGEGNVTYTLEWRESGWLPENSWGMYNVITSKGVKPDTYSAEAGYPFVLGIRNWINGGNGNDTIIGGDKFDMLAGDKQNDVITAGEAGAEIYGGLGNDTIYGNVAAKDWINPDQGDDTIYLGENRTVGDVIVLANTAQPRNNGTNTIYDANNLDTLKFAWGTNGFKFNELKFFREYSPIIDPESGEEIGGTNDLLIKVNDATYGIQTNIIKGYFDEDLAERVDTINALIADGSARADFSILDDAGIYVNLDEIPTSPENPYVPSDEYREILIGSGFVAGMKNNASIEFAGTITEPLELVGDALTVRHIEGELTTQQITIVDFVQSIEARYYCKLIENAGTFLEPGTPAERKYETLTLNVSQRENFDNTTFMFEKVNILGTNAADSYVGWNGNDTIEAGAGNDIIEGGEGSDLFIFNSTDEGSDLVKDATDEDFIRFNQATFDGISFAKDGTSLMITTENGSIEVQNYFAAADSNEMAATAVNQFQLVDGETVNTYTLEWRNSSVYGWDMYRIDNTGVPGLITDNVYTSVPGIKNWLEGSDEPAETDYMSGGNKVDLISGNSGVDALIAGSDGSEIYGGAGDDYLQGGAGADYLMGGAGDDVVVLADRVLDVTDAETGEVITPTADKDRIFITDKDAAVARAIGFDLVTGANSNDSLEFAIDNGEGIQGFSYDELSFIRVGSDLIINVPPVTLGGDLQGVKLVDFFEAESPVDTLKVRTANGEAIETKSILNSTIYVDLALAENANFVPSGYKERLAVVSDPEVIGTVQGLAHQSAYEILFNDETTYSIGADGFLQITDGTTTVKLTDYSYDANPVVPIVRVMDSETGTLDDATTKTLYVSGLTTFDADGVGFMNYDITGTDGNDTLSGAAATADTITGGEGADTFVFNVGDGSDKIMDATDVDTIKFSEVDTFEGMIFEKGSNLIGGNATSLYISYGGDANGENRDTIEVKNYFDAEGNVAEGAVKYFAIQVNGGAYRTYELAWKVSPYDNNEYMFNIDRRDGISAPKTLIGIKNWVIADDGGDQEIALNDGDVLYGGAAHDNLGVSADVTGGIYANGGADNDWVVGGAGDDILVGGAGNDLLIGGSGVDSIYGGAGADTIIGVAGNDELYGGSDISKDTFIFGTTSDNGVDTIYDADVNDVIKFVGQTDFTGIVFAQNNNDLVISYGEYDAETEQYANTVKVAGYFTGANTVAEDAIETFALAQSPESETIEYTLKWHVSPETGVGNMYVEPVGAVTLDGVVVGPTVAGLQNWIAMEDGADTITGGAKFDMLSGGEGDDIITSGAGGAEIYAGAGADTLVSGAGADVMYAGDDTDVDVFRFAAGSGDDVIAQAKVNDVIEFTDATSFEGITFTLGYELDGANATSLYIDYADGDSVEIKNYFTLNAANQYVQAPGTVHTFRVDDVDYNLQWHISPSDNMGYMYNIPATPENANIIDGIQNWVIATDNADDITTGDKYDMVAGNAGDDVLTSSVAAEIYGGAGADTIIGGAEDDYLVGGTGNDSIVGGEGDDILYGDDVATQGTGADEFVFSKGDGHDTIVDATGVDKITFKDVAWKDLNFVKSDRSLVINYNKDEESGEYLDSVTINNFYTAEGTVINEENTIKDVYTYDSDLKPNELHNLFDVKAPIDKHTDEHPTINYFAEKLGTDGPDLLKAGNVNTWIEGGAGNDTIVGGSGNDALFGGTELDRYNLGASGNDVIIGGTGDDVIYGGAGNDTITGGLDSDTYAFTLNMTDRRGFGNDIITDCSIVDNIRLRLAYADGEGGYVLEPAGYYDEETGLPVMDLDLFTATKDGDDVILTFGKLADPEDEDSMVQGSIRLPGFFDNSEYRHTDTINLANNLDYSILENVVFDVDLNNSTTYVGNKYNERVAVGDEDLKLTMGAGNNIVMIGNTEDGVDVTLKLSDGERTDLQLGEGLTVEAAEKSANGKDLIAHLSNGTNVIVKNYLFADTDAVITITDDTHDKVELYNYEEGGHKPFAEFTEFDENNVNTKGVLTASPTSDKIDVREFVSASNKGVKINTGAGNDDVYGSAYDDTIIAPSGNNNIKEWSGSNVIKTGKGNDTFELMGTSSNVVKSRGGINEVNISTTGKNTITLAAGADILNIENGNNTVKSGAGNDEFTVTGGKNTITAGKGSKEFFIYDGDNTITSKKGDNWVEINYGGLDPENEPIGKNMYNKITTGGASDWFFIENGTNTINAGAGDDYIWINQAANAGVVSVNSVNGGKGHDTFTVSAGNSKLFGGKGSDVFIFDNSTNDLIATANGGAGSDTYDLTDYDFSKEGSSLSIVDKGGKNTLILAEETDAYYSEYSVYFNVSLGKKGKAIADKTLQITQYNEGAEDTVGTISYTTDGKKVSKGENKGTLANLDVQIGNRTYKIDMQAVTNAVAGWLRTTEFSSTDAVLANGTDYQKDQLMARYATAIKDYNMM